MDFVSAGRTLLKGGAASGTLAGLLAWLSDQGEGDFVAAASALEIANNALSSHLQRLEAAGYVILRRGFLGRKPRTRIVMTATGRAVHGEIMPIALDMERRLFAPLSTSEVQTFKGLLARIYTQAASHGEDTE